MSLQPTQKTCDTTHTVRKESCYFESLMHEEISHVCMSSINDFEHSQHDTRWNTYQTAPVHAMSLPECHNEHLTGTSELKNISFTIDAFISPLPVQVE